MNKELLVERIKARAQEDLVKRKDPRFLSTMAFLVAKGFLNTNFEVLKRPNARLRIADAIWAGKNVEPRILEVLPAAVLRLRNHFDLDQQTYPQLFAVVELLRRNEEQGQDFCGVPYQKLKVWADFPLQDRRVKLNQKKKIVKTFRLHLETIEQLKKIAKDSNQTETEVLERLIKIQKSRIK
jgi:hypothetical protein